MSTTTLAPLAAPDVDLTTVRAEARDWHALYREHVLRSCLLDCRTGGLCPRGRLLLLEADDADRRVALATRAASERR